MMRYKKGYKYQLVQQEAVYLPKDLHVSEDIKLDYIEILAPSTLIVKKGYAWDGPSGPTIDTKTFMRGSLFHDALYQLIRNGLLPPSYRQPADKFLRFICEQDGMISIRAWWVYHGVRLGGGPSASPENIKEVLYA